MIVRLQEKDYFNAEIEMHIAVLQTAGKIGPDLHAHDFFEIVLLTAGEIGHHINGRQVTLMDGSLTLIRPEDAHFYRPRHGHGCQVINLAITRRVIEELFAYLGEGFHARRILESPYPPTVNLPPLAKAQVKHKLEQLHAIPWQNNSAKRSALRILLFELITQYFPLVTRRESVEMPDWLQDTCRMMQKPENLAQGVPRMVQLANVSPEHLSRTTRRFLQQTPTQFINQLRLTYAANLLTHGDHDIVGIAAEVGFESLSYFYTLFKKRYDQTPRQFRQEHQPWLTHGST